VDPLLSPPPSHRCRFHRRRRRGYRPAAASTKQIPSTQLSQAVAIAAATTVVAAVAVAFAAAIAAAIGVTIAAANNPIFWRTAKNTGVILRPQTPLSYSSQKKTEQSDVTRNTAKICAKKNAANFVLRPL
jgi:NADPH:quinone reductase-like Zn-dependent oxidoreductase